MLRTLSPTRHPAPVGRFRARLCLESLERREQPSSIGQYELLPEPPPSDPPLLAANLAPQIVEFTAEEVGNGLFVFTGRVLDENPGGLTVTFGGGVPSVAGLTTTADANGEFILTIRLRTDGTESGTVSVTTTDAQGAVSAEALVYVSPTP